MLKLEDDRHCFACGEKNPSGLRLTFRWDGTVLSCSFRPEKRHQGYRDIVHGGIVSTVLDECMAHAAIRATGRMAATAEFIVRFRSPLRIGEQTLTEAQVERTTRRLVEARAVMKRASNGAVIAEASGKFMLTGGSGEGNRSCKKG